MFLNKNLHSKCMLKRQPIASIQSFCGEKNLVWCIEIRLQIQNTIIRKMKLRFHALSASEHQMKKKSARTHGLLMSFVWKLFCCVHLEFIAFNNYSCRIQMQCLKCIRKKTRQRNLVFMRAAVAVGDTIQFFFLFFIQFRFCVGFNAMCDRCRLFVLKSQHFYLQHFFF